MSQAEWAAAKREGKVGARGGITTTTTMKNGEGSIKVTTEGDGSETHSYFDADGNCTAVAYRSAEYADHLASGGTLSNYTGNTDFLPSGGGKELSSLSFQFQKTSSNWQVAVVSNLVMSIQIAGQPGSYKEVNFTIEVGVPIKKKDGIIITPSYAANQAAWAANQAAVIVGGMYATEYFNPGVSTALPKQFAATMMGFLNTEIGGARVTSPPTSGGVKPTPAVFCNKFLVGQFFRKIMRQLILKLFICFIVNLNMAQNCRNEMWIKTSKDIVGWNTIVGPDILIQNGEKIKILFLHSRLEYEYQIVNSKLIRDDNEPTEQYITFLDNGLMKLSGPNYEFLYFKLTHHDLENDITDVRHAIIGKWFMDKAKNSYLLFDDQLDIDTEENVLKYCFDRDEKIGRWSIYNFGANCLLELNLKEYGERRLIAIDGIERSNIKMHYFNSSSHKKEIVLTK